ncbi:MAG: hypothetical protein FWE62_06300 [Firmicutes bacterium]|nr:hypothetical protein [Bacillota bacterium]
MGDLWEEKNVNNTRVSYSALWDDNRLYFAVKAWDTTPNAKNDMIEVGMTYRGVYWGYFLASFDPWLSGGSSYQNPFSNGTSTFIDSGTDAETGCRTLIFAINLSNRSMLKLNESIEVSVSYYDYDLSGKLIHRIQSGSRISGYPDISLPFADPPGTLYSESPDTKLYDEVYAIYL